MYSYIHIYIYAYICIYKAWNVLYYVLSFTLIYIHVNKCEHTRKHHVAAWVQSFSIFSEPTSPYTQIDHLPHQSSCTHACEWKRRPGREGYMAVRIRQAHSASTLAHQQVSNQNEPAVSRYPPSTIYSIFHIIEIQAR